MKANPTRIVAKAPSLAPKLIPTLLRDVLRMKRNRGDNDAEQFKALACELFASRLDATIGGAARTARQYIAQGAITGSNIEAMEQFIADLDAVLAGDMTGWDIGQVEAA